MPSTALAEMAIRWYGTAARDLPWRRPGTSAWGVLISEVMLQQTPVARVAPVWEEWLTRWPTPATLAAQPAGEAIRAWGRLGYPRRALRLHTCSSVLVARYNGEVPSDLGQLLDLPGVGSYTARAVAAFAYGQRHPVVDTNVRRLVARACCGLPDGAATTTAADLTRTEALLPATPSRAARASAALMELGAVVCTARTPACERCPLQSVCAWRKAGLPGRGGSDPRGADPRGADPRGADLHGGGLRGSGRRSQGYVGTDRQVRGLLLALARESPGGVGQATMDAAWPDPVQRRRALEGLLADALLVRAGDVYALPGLATAPRPLPSVDHARPTR
jgi:A/G-specific adenine glycosylase